MCELLFDVRAKRRTQALSWRQHSSRCWRLVVVIACCSLLGCGSDPPKQAQNNPAPEQTDPSSDSGGNGNAETAAGNSSGNPASEGTSSAEGTSAAESSDNDPSADVENSDSGDAHAEDAHPESAAPPFDLDQATERFLFFTPQGPLIVELVLAIDGAPYMAVVDGLIERLLATEDGEPLTWEQALSDVRFVGLRLNTPPDADQDLEAQIAMWDSNSDGIANAEEVRSYISGNMDETARATVTFDGSATRTVLDRWWRMMDADRDGRLTQDEADSVSSYLQQRDTDDDEVVGVRDILPSQLSADDSRESAPLLSVHVTDLTNWNTVAYQLDERYYVDGELSAASFPLDPQLFDNLDLDGDGFLRTNEVARLAEIAPHVIINVNFGESLHRPVGLHPLSSVSILTPAEDTQPSASRTRFEISGSQVAFRSADAGGADSAMRQAMQFIRQFDDNQDGYLDEAEAGAAPFAAAARFSILDADDNEMLVAEEIVPALTWSQATRLTDITIAIRGEEHSAFAALDVNTDGRITAREMQSAGQRLMTLDADGDGEVGYRDLPTSISVEIRRADGDAAAAPVSEELRWFDSMDTNDDGDISRREFLGSDDQFQTLDANEDGLIDRDEALAAGQF